MSDNSASRAVNYAGAALLIRLSPVLLGGAAWSAACIMLWIPQLTGELSLRTAYLPLDWHSHERLYGYVAAVIAGFLLTAIPAPCVSHRPHPCRLPPCSNTWNFSASHSRCRSRQLFQRMGALGLACQKVADCRRIDPGVFFVRGRQCPGFAGTPDQHGVTDLDARSAVDSGIDRDVRDV